MSIRQRPLRESLSLDESAAGGSLVETPCAQWTREGVDSAERLCALRRELLLACTFDAVEKLLSLVEQKGLEILM